MISPLTEASSGLQVVHLRVQKLQQQGRCVVVVGDLNISPAPMDSCCSGTGECFCLLGPACHIFAGHIVKLLMSSCLLESCIDVDLNVHP